MVYCCLGCRIASGITGSDEELGNRGSLTRLGMAVFFTMNVMVFTMVLWSWNVHEIAVNTKIHAFRELLRYACLLFAAPVLVLLGGPLAESSWDALRRRVFTTDVLLLLGVCAAFLYSTASLLLGLPDVYFEVVCMILVAVTLGKWLEATAKQKATNALRSLRKLLPETVRLRNVDGQIENIVPLEAARLGDELRVLAGERIPVDGVIQSLHCTVDEQVITGESIPLTKLREETVYGGTLNLDGDLYLRATSTASTGVIARLVEAVEASTISSCQAIRTADRLAGWFVPLIVIAASGAFYLHRQSGIQHALMAALSVVLIACPCALGIATPLALWVAINSAVRRGVLFRNGDAVASLANVRSVAFDKTGTITKGDIRVVAAAYCEDENTNLVNEMAWDLARSSNHVLSKAVLQSFSSETHPTIAVEVRDVAGKGVCARQNSEVAMLGSPEFANELGLALPPILKHKIECNPQHAVVCVGWGDRVRGVFLLGEQLRPESLDVFRSLQRSKLELVILTGDRHERAAAIDRMTGVRTIGQLMPEEKSKQLATLPHPVAMIGDGINDAMALATADVGIALDCGVDVSRDLADVCLMGNTLENLPWAIELARATQRTIRRNLVWAVGYNVVGIGFAVTGNLNPIVAAIAMVGSSLFVLTSSLSLPTSIRTLSPGGNPGDRRDARPTGLDSLAPTPACLEQAQ